MEMKHRGPELDPEIEALLRPHRIQRQVPPALRARVLARARATLAGEAIAPASAPPPAPVSIAPGRRLLRIAVVASIAIAGAAVGAVAGLHGRSLRVPEVAPPESAPQVEAPIGEVGARPNTPPATVKEPAAPARTSHAMRAAPKSDPFTAELELLQRAQAAYTRRDLSIALAVIAEHARRFPNGHLAEQREALRVRSLAGAGRADEAHRAAAAFAARFPRSVLLPRVEEESGPSPR